MKIGDTVYADYQASTPVDPRVLNVLMQAEKEHFANPHAADHILGWRAASAVSNAADAIANFFGFDGADLIFTSGASEANALAISALREQAFAENRKKFFVGAGDHKSVLSDVSRSDLTLVEIDLDDQGSPSVEFIKNKIDTGCCAVSVIGVNNENGAIADIKSISEICADVGALLHVDLAQAPLAITEDWFDLGVHFATVSSHKVYGPKGIGALLVAPHVVSLVKALVPGGGQQNGMRGGTIPTPLCIAFAEAIRILDVEGEGERDRVDNVRDYFVGALESEQLGSLVGGIKNRHPGNALVRFKEWEASDLLARMQPHVAAASQSACSSGEISASHVLTAMGLSADEAKECVRFSFGRFSDQEQATAIVEHLREAMTSEA